MAENKKQPLIIVPPGLKHWFMQAAWPDKNVVPYAEIREIDPTLPGDEEIESRLRGDYYDESAEPTVQPPRPRLVTLDGKKLDP